MRRRELIDEDTRAIAVGCIQLDVEMARAHGWTERDIAETWENVSLIVRSMNRSVAARVGHTRQCDTCECWTAPRGPCHRCALDGVG